MTLGRILRFLPIPFWCYILPMLATTMGLLPSKHPLYDFASKQLLPVSLFLLLIGTDLKSLVRLGPMATLLMLAGSLGTILGGLIGFQLYERWLPEGSWAGIGALSATWTGGSANFLAVKEALNLSDTLVGPLVIVDALVAYSWMALLVSGSGLQPWWDMLIWGNNAVDEATRGLRGEQTVWSGSGHGSRPPKFVGGRESERDSRAKLTTPGSTSVSANPRSPSGGLATGIALSIAISLIAQMATQRLPVVGAVISPQTWTILLVTTASLLLSLTPLSKAGEAGTSKVGTFALYLLLISIGARANFRGILEAPIFLILGITCVAIHGFCLLLAGYFLKAPLGLIATASQANIGGTISAPIVGATYHPGLASVGLLMAILGNILGTYLGLLTAALARTLI